MALACCFQNVMTTCFSSTSSNLLGFIRRTLCIVKPNIFASRNCDSDLAEWVTLTKAKMAFPPKLVDIWIAACIEALRVSLSSALVRQSDFFPRPFHVACHFTDRMQTLKNEVAGRVGVLVNMLLPVWVFWICCRGLGLNLGLGLHFLDVVTYTSLNVNMI